MTEQERELIEKHMHKYLQESLRADASSLEKVISSKQTLAIVDLIEDLDKLNDNKDK